jgi:CBS domain-containing protein
MTAVKTELKARDVMAAEPVCVEPSTSIRRLVRLFEEYEISGAPVVDEEGKVVGMVTKTDLIRRGAKGTAKVPPAYLFEVLGEQGGEEESGEVSPEPPVCVEDFMSEEPLLVGPDASAAAVARLMHERGLHRVIVADEERFPLGVITSLDLLRCFPAAGPKTDAPGAAGAVEGGQGRG